MEKLAVALPKGRLLPPTAQLLKGWELKGYTPESRNYRPVSAKFPEVKFKVFQEKDIPVQVSVGNYDLGICGLHWVEELLARYPQSPLVKVHQLGYGRGALYLACHKSFPTNQLKENKLNLRLASEFPNLLEAQALRWRLRYFRLFPLYGSAHVYPPEDADLVLLPASSEQELEKAGLQVLGKAMDTCACLIANRESWQRKEMEELLRACLEGGVREEIIPMEEFIQEAPPERTLVRLALPDGHQQEGAVRFLKERGVKVEEYKGGRRRPDLGIEGLSVKVIRPQDMPLQVACGNFDLAITGRDWLLEHLCQFPSSPVEKLADLGFGWVRVVAVVHNAFPVQSLEELRQYLATSSRPLKVASEYINLADRYCRENHLSPYRLIPTFGASEALLPEDADLLIENTQTGRTLAEHNLKIIDTLFQSTACLIANRIFLQTKKDYLEPVLKILNPPSG